MSRGEDVLPFFHFAFLYSNAVEQAHQATQRYPDAFAKSNNKRHKRSQVLVAVLRAQTPLKVLMCRLLEIKMY